MSNKMIDITVEIIHETDAAFLVNDGDEDVWVPKSQIENNEDLYVGCCDVIYIPVWLALDKGFI